MANLKLVKSATALVLGASVLTSAVAVSGTDASAKTTYKVTKKGTLVNAKTNKAVQGYKSYKGKLYKNGKKLTGTYKSVFYKSGVKFTGTYNKKYYVKGKLFTGKTSKNVYYKKGVKFTGVTSYGYTYKDGIRVEGEYQGKVYKNGKLYTGLYKDVLYTKGVKEAGLKLYKDKLYKDGVLNLGYVLYDGKELYNNADKNVGWAIDPFKDGKAYYDTLLANATYTDPTTGAETAYEDGVAVGAKVKAVEAINGKTVVITFNKKIDSDYVIDASKHLINIDLEGVTEANTTASLSEDGRTLTVKLPSALTEGNSYTATFDGVRTAAGEKLAKYATVFTLTDKNAANVVSATAVTKDSTTKQVTVKFSEDVTFTSAKINGKFIVGQTGSGDEYTFTAADDLEVGKTYDIELNNVKDDSNNNVEVLKSTVTVTQDTVKPVASLEATGEKTFNVNFDKAMSNAVSATSVKVYDTTSGSDVAVSLKALPTYDTKGEKSFAVELANIPFTGTQTSKTYKVVVSGLQDKLGNKMADYTNTVTFNKDTVKPELVSVAQAVNDDTKTKLKAKFSEKIATDLSSAGAFNVVDADGKLVTVNGSAVTVTGTDLSGTPADEATLTLSSALPKSGTYKLVSVQGTLSDTASVANKNAAKTVSFSYTAPEAAAIPAVTATIPAGSLTSDLSDAANRTFKVTFDKEVVKGIDATTGTYKVGAADNSANYTIDGQALPTGTTVTVVNASDDISDSVSTGAEATIILPANVDQTISAFKNGGQVSVVAKDIKSVAGSTISYTTKAVAVADETAPTVAASYLTKTVSGGSTVYTLTVEFSEKVTASTVTATSIVLNNNTTAIDITTTAPTIAVAADGKSATFTYDASSNASLASAVSADNLKLSVTTDLTDAATTPNAAAAATGITVLNYAK